MAGLPIKVDWHDLDQLAAHLRRLPKSVAEAVEDAQDEDLRDVASLLGDYPPQKPGTHYERTGNLGLGWLEARVKTIRRGQLNFEKSLSNPVEYAGDVQGGKGDKPSQLIEFARRGWKTTDQALAETEGRAQRRLDAAVQAALDKTLGK
jgi:hypothetical protein